MLLNDSHAVHLIPSLSVDEWIRFSWSYDHDQSVLPKGSSFNANSDTKAVVLPLRQVFPPVSGTKVAVLLGMNTLLSTSHSLFSIWTYHKISEKISGAPTWRWGQRIWLTGPSGLYPNLPRGLNISFIRVFDRIRDPEIRNTLRLQL